jgi:predicted PurR-regulated permease PerM
MEMPKAAGPPLPRPRPSFIELAIRLGFLALLLYWTLVLIRPFISIIVWSVVVAVVLYPSYKRLSARLGGRQKLAAFLVTALAVMVVVGPTAYLTMDLIESVGLLSERINWHELSIPAAPLSVKSWPIIGEDVYRAWNAASANTSAAFAKLYPYLKPVGSTVVQIAADAGIGVLKFLVSVVVAGFLLVPAPNLVNATKRLARKLEAEKGEQLLDLASMTIRAVSRGVIGIAVAQALLAGIGLTVIGVPAASLLTFAILILGIAQIGASPVTIPALIWVWMSKDTTAAILFTAYIVPVNFIDNVLRPFVFAQGLRTPMLVVLIGVIGGTISHGITGLFLGPIILAVIWELLMAWIGMQKAEQAQTLPEPDAVEKTG